MSTLLSQVKQAKPEQLDEVVQQAASEMASNANNGGKSEQINFLLAVAGWSEEDILEALPDPD